MPGEELWSCAHGVPMSKPCAECKANRAETMLEREDKSDYAELAEEIMHPTNPPPREVVTICEHCNTGPSPIPAARNGRDKLEKWRKYLMTTMRGQQVAWEDIWLHRSCMAEWLLENEEQALARPS